MSVFSVIGIALLCVSLVHAQQPYEYTQYTRYQTFYPQPYQTYPYPYRNNRDEFFGFSHKQAQSLGVATLGLLAAGALGYVAGTTANNNGQIVVGKRSLDRDVKLEEALRLFNKAMELDEWTCLPQAICGAAHRGQREDATVIEKAVTELAQRVNNHYGEVSSKATGGELVFYASVFGLTTPKEHDCVERFPKCKDSKPVMDAMETYYSLRHKRSRRRRS